MAPRWHILRERRYWVRIMGAGLILVMVGFLPTGHWVSIVVWLVMLGVAGWLVMQPLLDKSMQYESEDR